MRETVPEQLLKTMVEQKVETGFFGADADAVSDRVAGLAHRRFLGAQAHHLRHRADLAGFAAPLDRHVQMPLSRSSTG